MKHNKISLFEMVASISEVIDLISPELNGHHRRVAYIASNLAEKLLKDERKQNDIIFAALLHDCGAISLKERLDALSFEMDAREHHCDIGYRLLKDLQHFENIAELIKNHHRDWNVSDKSNSVTGSQIIHLADRIDVLIKKDHELHSQKHSIRQVILGQSGSMFSPELVECFIEISSRDEFWSILPSKDWMEGISQRCSRIHSFDTPEMENVVMFIRRMVDFRSRFTASHSSGVAAVSEALSNLAGLPSETSKQLRMAGYLHDIGKLAVPAELLDKKAALNREEFEIVKSHAVHTYNTLAKIKGLEQVGKWASYHHERLNGKGYPFGLTGEQIPMEARIVGAADVFTAISEDRPYRKGMEKTAATELLHKMGNDGELDSSLVRLVTHNYKSINRIRLQAQQASAKEYKAFMAV